MSESADENTEHSTAPASDERAAAFERHRPRLFGIAYRMLGSVEDAEDLVQEAYLRWHRAAAPARSDEAWLVAVTTRLAIDRLRRAATERAAYVGSWLPEPLATAPPPPLPDRGAELASDLSIAFLVLLERLAPEERAAFLLREVFGADYRELARVLERSEAACRQMVHRARERVRAPEPRAATSFASAAPPSPEERTRLVERFVTALAAEDEAGLLAVFADDVILVSDGGGKAPSVREVVSGADRVARLAVGYERKGRGYGVTHEVAWINGEPAVLTLVAGRTAFTTSFAIEGGRIAAVYRVLNPDKLRRVGPPPYFDDAPTPPPPASRESE